MRTLIEHLRQGVIQFSRGKETVEPQWKAFASHLAFQNADFDDPQVYTRLAKHLAALDKEWDTKANRILYLAVPPSAIETVVDK